MVVKNPVTEKSEIYLASPGSWTLLYLFITSAHEQVPDFISVLWSHVLPNSECAFSRSEQQLTEWMENTIVSFLRES